MAENTLLNPVKPGKNVNRRHPILRGRHIVRKRLSSGQEVRYVYARRGGHLMCKIEEGDDTVSKLLEVVWAARRAQVITLFKACEKRAKSRGMDFALTEGWLNEQLVCQEDRCSVTGLAFDYRLNNQSGYSRNPYRPSIDRIDSRLGYTVENVRIVLVAVNTAMNEWGLETFLEIAGAAVRHKKHGAALFSMYGRT